MSWNICAQSEAQANGKTPVMMLESSLRPPRVIYNL